MTKIHFYIITTTLLIAGLLSNAQQQNQHQHQQQHQHSRQDVEIQRNLSLAITTIITPTTTAFMNETNTTEINQDDHQNKNDDKLDFLQENFDFNPDDFEDLHENFKRGHLNFDSKQKIIDKLSDDNRKQFIGYFETNQYEQEQTEKDQDTETDTDKNIYRIASKGKLNQNKNKLNNDDVDGRGNNVGKEQPQSPINSKLILPDTKINQNSVTRLVYNNNNNSEINSFHLITNLFDHTLWNENDLLKNLTSVCGREIEIYLINLRNLSHWAVRGKILIFTR